MGNIKEGDIQMPIRMPRELWREIKDHSEANFRSANAQMLLWIYRGLKEDRDKKERSNVL